MASTQLQIQIQGNASGFVKAINQAASTLGNLKPITQDAVLAFQDLKKASEKALQFKGGSSGISSQAAAIGSLKQQYREAVKEVQNIVDKFGYTSREAAKAASAAALLKDKIGDANTLVEAFNPDRKFQAFSGAIQGVLGGFTAVQGALATFGIKNQEVERTLLKVQAALAISQGLNSVLSSIDAFRALGLQIKAISFIKEADIVVTRVAATVQKAFTGSVLATGVAFRVLKYAIVSTGLGILIVLIGEAVAAIMQYASSTGDAEDAQKKFNDQLERQKRISEGTLSAIDFATKKKVLEAQIAGKSESELTEIQKQGLQDRITQLKKDLKENENAMLDNATRMALLHRGTKEDEQKLADERTKILTEQASIVKEITEAERNIIINNLELQLKISTDGRQRINDNLKKSQEEAKKNKEDLLKKSNDLDNQYLNIEIEDLKKQLEEKKKLNLESTTDYADVQNKLFELSKLRIDKEYNVQKDAILSVGSLAAPLAQQSLAALQKIYDSNVLKLTVEIYGKEQKADFNSGKDLSTSLAKNAASGFKNVSNTVGNATAEVKDRIANFYNSIGASVVEGGQNIGPLIEDSLVGLSQTIGKVLMGNGSIGDVLAAGAEFIIHTIGNVLEDLGKQLIELGVIKVALDNVLKGLFALPGAAQIAVGIGLVALGAAFKSFKSSVKNATPFAEGGIVTGPTLAMVGEAGSEAIIPLSKFDQVVGGRGTMDVFVTGQLSGEMIFLQQQRAINRRERFV